MPAEEKKTEVKSYRIDLICECGYPMSFTGRILTSNPPLYPHECQQCGINENKRIKYPYIKTE